MIRALAVLFLLLVPTVGQAESPIERAQEAELRRVRRKVASQVQLSAYDLVDELVYGWTQDPPFDKPTPVVLAGATVPVGLGTGMQAQLENHIHAVLLENPSTNLRMVHCPTCTQVVVQSGPEATVVTRGIDNPAVFDELGIDAGKHALFVDIEAEGASLVLRARLTRLTPDLPIVWSRTISTSMGTPALLREASDLKSAEEAREEYLDALRDRGVIDVLAKINVRSYGLPDDPTTGTAPPPFAWIHAGVEFSPTAARDWTADFTLGGSFIPQAYQGLMLEARINRLVTGRARSHTHPDLYLFLGGAVSTVWGSATASFVTEPITAEDILRGNAGDDPRAIFGSVLTGFDLRLGQRIGFSGFLETLPGLRRSPNLGDHVRVLGIGFQSFGVEVILCF